MMEDLKVSQTVKYKNNPFDGSIPVDNREVKVREIMSFRSRTTGNQCVLLEGDCMVRDINELVLMDAVQDDLDS